MPNKKLFGQNLSRITQSTLTLLGRLNLSLSKEGQGVGTPLGRQFINMGSLNRTTSAQAVLVTVLLVQDAMPRVLVNTRPETPPTQNYQS
jgi:hypothetical protein